MEKSKKPVIVLALITAICLLGDAMLYVALPTHWKEIGLTSLMEVGVILSVNRFVRLPLNPLIGFLYRKFPVRNGILIAVFLAGLTTTLYGYTHVFWLWIVLRSIWGLAWSFLKLGAYLIILQLSTDSNRGEYMGTYNGVYRIGSLIGMLIGGFLADWYGIRFVATIFGAIVFIAIPMAIRYVSKFNMMEVPNELSSHKQFSGSFLTRKVLWTFVTIFLVVLSLEGMLTATLSHLIEIRFPGGVTLLGTVLGAATFTGILQAMRWSLGPWISPWIGKISDGKMGRIRTLIAILGTASILLILMPIHMPGVIWVLIVFLIMLVSSLFSTVSDAHVSDMAARSSKTGIMTVYTIVLDVGAAFGPITGYMVDRLAGPTAMLWGAAGILFFLTLGWGFVVIKEQRDNTESVWIKQI
jgi:MFS family permease